MNADEARYDVVVVGSGFGGAITAFRLAEAGRKVLVLERGKRWVKEEFPRSPRQGAQLFWEGGDGPGRGILEYRSFSKVDVLAASCVGGGSQVYFNVRLRARDEIFTPPRWPAQITPRVMARYYDLVDQRISHGPFPNVKEHSRAAAYIAAAESSGVGWQPMPLALYHGPPTVGLGGTRSGCNACGNCLIGCHAGAKNSVDFNYLAEAERLGVEVRPLHEVTQLEPVGEGYRLRFRVIEEDGSEPKTLGSVVAKQVVLAAGTLGTTELLLRSRDQHHCLTGLSARLGAQFSANGDYIYSGASGGDPGSDPTRGPTIMLGSRVETEANLITVQDLGIPEPFAWYLEGLNFVPRKLSSILLIAASWLNMLLGRGPLLLGRHINMLFGNAYAANLIFYLAMGTDSGDGRVRLGFPRPRNKAMPLEIDWSMEYCKVLYAEIEDNIRKLSKARGAKMFSSPLWQPPLRKILTGHPLGGCVMGETAQTGVVDHRGQVFGHKNLFIADGSSIPGALAVNPSLTISAVAERVAQWMIHGEERA